MPATVVTNSESKTVLFNQMETDTPYRSDHKGWTNYLVFKISGVNDRVFYIRQSGGPIGFTTGFETNGPNVNTQFYKIPGDKITIGV